MCFIARSILSTIYSRIIFLLLTWIYDLLIYTSVLEAVFFYRSLMVIHAILTTVLKVIDTRYAFWKHKLTRFACEILVDIFFIVKNNTIEVTSASNIILVVSFYTTISMQVLLCSY